jgi:hypothetical protein
MKTRTIIIFVVILLLIIIAAPAVYFLTQKKNGIPSNTSTASSSDGGEEVTLPAVQVLTNVATGTELTIGTPQGSVQMNNFYLSNPSTTDGGETVILENTTDYLLTYDTFDSSFWIGIDPNKFYALRTVAEQDLMSILGVSTTDMCKLNISEGVFYSPTSSLSGQSLPLSFCGNLNISE